MLTSVDGDPDEFVLERSVELPDAEAPELVPWDHPGRELRQLFLIEDQVVALGGVRLVDAGSSFLPPGRIQPFFVERPGPGGPILQPSTVAFQELRAVPVLFPRSAPAVRQELSLPMLACGQNTNEQLNQFRFSVRDCLAGELRVRRP
ncbi:MAG: hypothetical protein ACFCGT_03500 [Sandaracinaceae bacterium]